jgi:hypothetical protein
MCDEESIGIGDLVPGDTVIFRACTKKNFLTSSKDAVQPEAFQKQGTNQKDGLSLALTPVDAVRRLNRNHGVIRIRVQDIHDLGRGLEVRFDTQLPNHVLIRNMACMDRSPEERANAEATATELALRAQVESATTLTIPADTTSSSL